jgi:tetratricopeptide (TPR) repeat protein
VFAAAVVSLGLGRGAWADLADAQKLYNTGQYEECVDACRKARVDAEAAGIGAVPEGWWVLKVKAQLAIGRYPEALRSVVAGVEAHEASAELRLLGYEALRYNDHPDEALRALLSIRDLAEALPWRFQDAASRVTLGRAFVRAGADARKVLELYYDRAKKDSPTAVEPFMASGELALMKEDYALAAEQYREAAKRAPEDPEVFLGLARAFENDAEQAAGALNKAMTLNPRLVEGLLMQAENLINREAF